MFKPTRFLNYAALLLFIGLGLVTARQVLAQQADANATTETTVGETTVGETTGALDAFPPITAGSIVQNPVFHSTPGDVGVLAAEASAPVMSLFYGENQKFGQIGTPQRWVNILGNVTGAKNLTAINFTLNGGATPQPLGWGSDRRRLADAGDFNVEIDASNLLEGANQILVSAFYSDSKSVTQTVTLQNKRDSVWPTTYTADWATTTNIQDLAQVVDGKWKIEAGALRTDQFDYDRLVAIGDKSWTDYEVVVPITIHSTDPLTGAGFKYPSNGPGIGLLLRWQGHVNQGGEQPSVGYQQFGGLGWYRFGKVTKDSVDQLVSSLQFLGPGGRELQNLPDKQLQFNVPYIFKMSVQSDVGSPSYYRLKVWPASEVEPFAWDIEKQGKTGEPLTGSILLVAHHVDASFGKVTVKPLADLRPKLTIIANNGVVNILTPAVQADYAYGTNVRLKAVGNSGFELGSWGGDLAGNVNPLTVNLTKDTTVVANFVQGAPPTIVLGSAGSGTAGGTANVTPVKPTYNFGEQVTLTAVPKVGSQFVRWDGDTGGVANPKLITVTKSLSITAIFGPAVPPVSDDFNDCQINSNIWNFQDPVGNSSFQTNGQQLLINAPAGSDHNLWLNANQAPRLMQPIGNTDFSIEAKFESTVNQKFQLQGVIVQQDADNFMRFDYFNDGDGVKAFGVLFLNGTPVISETRKVTVPLGSNLFIRVQRKGDGFTYARSFDGASWSRVTTITQTLSINSVGVFAGNVAANKQTPAPAHTAIVDYFFNSATRILPEDSRGHQLDITKIGNGTVSVSPIKADYSCTEPIQVTAIPDSGWLFTGWAPAALGTGNSASLTLSQIPAVTANFTLNSNPNQFTLAATVKGSGTVARNPDKQAYDPNEQVTLTAQPAIGFKFVGWEGDVTDTQNPITVSMTANKTVTANFEFDPNAVQSVYLPLISN